MSQISVQERGRTGTAEPPLNDQAIREAMLAKPLRSHVQDDRTLVIHELGLVHARRRVDLAVINGVVHGYEIKSAVDGLERLPDQLETYSQALQKLTLVVADRHVDPVLDKAPGWCGVWRVYRGPRGGMWFQVLRRTLRNPAVDRFMLAHLLWRDEAQAILKEQGVDKVTLRAPRATLYEALAETVSEAQLTAFIKQVMMQRRIWRGQSRPS